MLRYSVMTVSIAVLVFPQSTPAQQLDSCSTVLSTELLTKRIQKNDTSYVAGENLWACSASEQEIENYIESAHTQNFSHAGQMGYSILSLGDSGSWNTSNEDKSSAIQHWKDSNCSENDRNMNYTSAGYFATQYLGDGVVQAWRDCELNLHRDNTLTCFAKPGQGNVVMVSDWFGTAISKPKITAFYTMVDGIKTDLPHADEMFIGPLETAIPRDPAKTLRIVLDGVREDRYNETCSVYIPSDDALQKPQSPPVAKVYSTTFTFGPQGQPRPNTSNTVWDAVCPTGQTVFSGACVSNAGAIGLQNFGPEPDNNRWSCVWTRAMNAADVHAMCAK